MRFRNRFVRAPKKVCVKKNKKIRFISYIHSTPPEKIVTSETISKDKELSKGTHAIIVLKLILARANRQPELHLFDFKSKNDGNKPGKRKNRK